MQYVNAKLIFPNQKLAGCKALLCVCIFCCMGAGYNRSELRDELNIGGSWLVDFILEALGCCLAVSQEWREVMQHVGLTHSCPIWVAFMKT
jgi:Cys-rich protein (TIGR01571 family)